MKINQFEDSIQKDLSWRKQEISKLLYILKTVDSNQEVMIKTIILLLYAHWEGFLKRSFKLYLKYVVEKKVKLTELTVNFKAIALKKKASECMTNNGLTLANELKFITSYEKMEDKKFKVPINIDNPFDENIIDTQHNLTSKVLKNICNIVGIKYNEAMKTRSNYIDAKLLKQRNSIGHSGTLMGKEFEEELLSDKEIYELKDFVFAMLDYYTDVLFDYTEKEFYLAEKNDERLKYEENQQNILELRLKEIGEKIRY